MKNEFLSKYASKILGVLTCLDRVVITGTLRRVCYADGMMHFLNRNGVRYKDYKQFVAPFRIAVRQKAEETAKAEGLKIDFIRRPKKVRKEDLVKKHLLLSGKEEGLVCILSAMERCKTYRYRYDKKKRRSYLQMTSGKCLHYYYYFIDNELGLCYLRVPTWSPFKAQFYFNGHNLLARQMEKAGINYEQEDNTFTYIEDFDRAQELADSFDVEQLHHLMDDYVDLYCPVAKNLDPLGRELKKK